MCAQTVDAGHGGEVEYDDATVRTAGHEFRAGQLELADERGVALEEGETFASGWGPDADGGVEGAGDDEGTVECDGVDLGVVTGECLEAFACIEVPQLFVFHV